MTFLGVPDIPTRDVGYFIEVLKGREAKLSEAKARRDKILVDLGKARDAVDAGDQRARFEQGRLNGENEAAGRLIRSLDLEVAEARKRVGMAEDQVKAMELKRAQADAAAVPGGRVFEVATPDGVRRIRHRAASCEALQKVLQPQYHVVSEIFGANEDDTGGFAASIGSDAKSNMMSGLLQAHGDVLMEWLAERGIVGSDKTVVILPSNGRSAQ
jgi:hypothetical protein